jgi:hypothetical protein
LCYTVSNRVGLGIDTKEALLLAGGVALAQGLFVTVDQTCFECWEAEPNGTEPDGPVPDEYIPHLTYGGWRVNNIDEVCEGVHSPGPEPVFEHEACWPPDAATDPCYTEFAVYCEGEWDGYDSCSDLGQVEQMGVADEVEKAYGQWVGWIEEYDGAEVVGHAEVTFRFAEDCAAAEFVPEPGTILLLGSGLMGLAGYAGLRWRTRE